MVKSYKNKAWAWWTVLKYLSDNDCCWLKYSHSPAQVRQNQLKKKLWGRTTGLGKLLKTRENLRLGPWLSFTGKHVWVTRTRSSNTVMEEKTIPTRKRLWTNENDAKMLMIDWKWNTYCVPLGRHQHAGPEKLVWRVGLPLPGGWHTEK